MTVWVILYFKPSGLRCEMTVTPLEWVLGRDINTLACIALLAMSFFLASASDPSPLQDFCVAVNDTKTTGIILMFFL